VIAAAEHLLLRRRQATSDFMLRDSTKACFGTEIERVGGQQVAQEALTCGNFCI